MKPVSTDFDDLLQEGVTTLCKLLRLTPQGRDTLYLTDHDRDIVYGGNTYVAAHSFILSSLDNALGTASLNFEIDLLLGDVITRNDVERGIYAEASIEIDAIFWDHIAAGVMPLATGLVSDGTLPTKNKATLSCSGFVAKSTHPLTEQYSINCRADFCDERCGLDIADFTHGPYTVTSVTGSLTIAATMAGITAGLLNLGHVQWLTGNNAGRTSDIQINTTGSIRMLIRPTLEVQVGDTFTVTEGCDKTLATCKNRFNNELNFRGEPFVPGQDFATSPTQQSISADGGNPGSGVLVPHGPTDDSWDWSIYL